MQAPRKIQDRFHSITTLLFLLVLQTAASEKATASEGESSLTSTREAFIESCENAYGGPLYDCKCAAEEYFPEWAAREAEKLKASSESSVSWACQMGGWTDLPVRDRETLAAWREHTGGRASKPPVIVRVPTSLLEALSIPYSPETVFNTTGGKVAVPDVPPCEVIERVRSAEVAVWVKTTKFDLGAATNDLMAQTECRNPDLVRRWAERECDRFVGNGLIHQEIDRACCIGEWVSALTTFYDPTDRRHSSRQFDHVVDECGE